MTPRPLTVTAAVVAALLVASVTSTTASALPHSPGGPHEMRITGELLKTSPEPGRPAYAAVRHAGQMVPIDPDGVKDVAAGDTVTVDVELPTSGDLSTASEPGQEALAATQVQATTTSASAYTPATRQVTYVNVTPRGLTPAPATDTQIRSQVAGANAFWRANSRDQLGVALHRIAPAFTSPYSCTDNPFAMWDDAARRVGYTGDANTSLVLVLPESAQSASCGYGLGSLGRTPNSPGYVYTYGRDADVLSHELGHNMSLLHANRLVCPTVSDSTQYSTGEWGTSCTVEEYGDGQDIMGIDNGATAGSLLSTPQALRTGMLWAGASTSVGVGTQTVTLKPLAGRAGLRSAKVKDPVTGVTYYVEYRTAAGLDAGNSWGNATGVRVLRWHPDLDFGGTYLLDPSPTGQRSGVDLDPVVRAGKTLRTVGGRVEVTTVSTSATQADVRITVKRGTFTMTRRPYVIGTYSVGRTLTARVGAWSPTPTSYSYQWYRGTTKITGATARTYTLRSSDAGTRVSVRVTARRAGVTSRSAYSLAAVVRR